MSQVAIIGLLGLCVVCSSSSAAMLMMGDEETSNTTGPSSTGPSSTGPSSTGPSSTGPSSTGPSTPTQDSLMSSNIPQGIYDNMKAQPSGSGVNAYKGNYYFEAVDSRYPQNVLFTVSSIPGSDWRAKETHCFNKCTDLGDDCRILTFKRDSSNNPIECSGMGVGGYGNRQTVNLGAPYVSYHKRAP